MARGRLHRPASRPSAGRQAGNSAERSSSRSSAVSGNAIGKRRSLTGRPRTTARARKTTTCARYVHGDKRSRANCQPAEDALPRSVWVQAAGAGEERQNFVCEGESIHVVSRVYAAIRALIRRRRIARRRAGSREPRQDRRPVFRESGRCDRQHEHRWSAAGRRQMAIAKAGRPTREYPDSSTWPRWRWPAISGCSGKGMLWIRSLVRRRGDLSFGPAAAPRKPSRRR